MKKYFLLSLLLVIPFLGRSQTHALMLGADGKPVASMANFFSLNLNLEYVALYNNLQSYHNNWVVAPASGAFNFYMITPTDQNCSIWFQNGTILSSSHRWEIVRNTAAETGSNAGSDFQVSRYDDAGNFLGQALTIIRATGNSQLEGYTTLGSTIAGTGSTLAIKVKKIEGVTSASDGADSLQSHGLTDTKIIAVVAQIEYSTGDYVSVPYAPGYGFNARLTVSVDSIHVGRVAGDSANISEKPWRAFIVYTE